MPGLDPLVAVHPLKISDKAVPIKQKPRRMRIELQEKVTDDSKWHRERKSDGDHERCSLEHGDYI